MSKPVFTILISLTGEYTICKREQVPYIDCKGSSLFKCKNILQKAIDF